MHNSAASIHIRMMRETSDCCFSVCPPLISRPGLVLHHHCPAPPHCHNPGILLIPRPIPCPHHRGTDERVGFAQRCHRLVCLCGRRRTPLTSFLSHFRLGQVGSPHVNFRLPLSSGSDFPGDKMGDRAETTLDEPVSVTLKRELRNIGDKMYKVVLPNSKLNSSNELRNCE